MGGLKLNPVLQGVDFRMVVLGRNVRVFVSAEVLHALGAGACPSSWLTTAAERMDSLKSLGATLYRQGNQVVVITPRVASSLLEKELA